MDPTSSMMPMGVSAQMPITAADMMPAMRGPAPPGAAVPPQAAGMMAGPGGTPLSMGSSINPANSAADMYDFQKQPDGSGLVVSKTNPPIIISVIPAPKLPQSLQPKPL